MVIRSDPLVLYINQFLAELKQANNISRNRVYFDYVNKFRKGYHPFVQRMDSEVNGLQNIEGELQQMQETNNLSPIFLQQDTLA
ncbi:MAG TPA: hypothetical protein VD884_04155 [Ohtaekwangia sp.]|nr:hypothetical protein [Ohtaekwangia sp.]